MAADHQPLTRASLAEAGDRLFAHGFCTVCGVPVAMRAPSLHGQEHVSQGEAYQVSSRIAAAMPSFMPRFILTPAGALAARTRAERERTTNADCST
jgi:hypothetical protein